MWCNIDKSKLPIIKISFSANKQIEAEFDAFLDEWLKLYDDKQYFYFIFDTRQLAMLNIKYAYKMSAFIKKLKKREEQYLNSSIIIVKNKYIRFLLNIVFSITKPVADVFLFSNHTDAMICEDIEGIYSEQNFQDVINDYKKSFSVMKSKLNKNNINPTIDKSVNNQSNTPTIKIDNDIEEAEITPVDTQQYNNVIQQHY